MTVHDKQACFKISDTMQDRAKALVAKLDGYVDDKDLGAFVSKLSLSTVYRLAVAKGLDLLEQELAAETKASSRPTSKPAKADTEPTLSTRVLHHTKTRNVRVHPDLTPPRVKDLERRMKRAAPGTRLSGRTLIKRATGVDHACLSRFINGRRELSPHYGHKVLKLIKASDDDLQRTVASIVSEKQSTT